jgi:hypothetical protein
MFSLSRLPGIKITPTKATAAAAVGVTSLAFWVSYTALSDLAAHNGISEAQAPALPLIVDGLTIVSTLAVYAAKSKLARSYAWMLLILGTAVSVAGNAAHALANGGSHIAVAIAVIPPLVQLASIHLAMTLIDQERSEAEVVPVSTVEGAAETGNELLAAA